MAEHGALVLRVCRALLDTVDADDAWAETFLSAMEAYPRLRPDSNVRGWLVTIAHRKAIDQIRAANRRPRPAGDLPEMPADQPVAAVIDDDLRAAVGELPPKQRGAVIAHYVAGLPYADVGTVLGTSEQAARRSAADGIRNLRQHFVRGTMT